MLIKALVPFHRGNRLLRKKRAKRPALPLTLVSATYDPGSSVTLGFDRPVNVDAFEPTAIVVADGEFAFARFVGDGAAMLTDPTTVVVLLAGGEGEATPGVRLTATAENGIVAAEDGAAWAGVEAVVLPFG